MKYRLVHPILIMLIALFAVSSGAAHLSVNRNTALEEVYNFAAPPSKDEGNPEDNDLEVEYTSAVKTETVYVQLDHYGSVQDKVIVNRLFDSRDHSAGMVADYGEYLSINNMVSADEPLIEADRLLWNSALLGEEALYYEGKLDKKLPVTIEIVYFLNGEEVSVDQLAGKEGYLELVIRCKNNLRHEGTVSYYDYYGELISVEDTNYVPLLVQGTVNLDLSRFSNVDTGEGMGIVTGSSNSINFMIFPYPEEEIRITMDGENIELEKISFVIDPRLPPLPAVEIEKDLIKIVEGMAQLSEGIKGLSAGSDRLLEGLLLFKNESDRLSTGTEEMTAYIDDYMEFRNQFQTLIDETSGEDIIQIIDSLQLMLLDLDNMPQSGEMTERISAVNSSSAALKEQLDFINENIEAIENRSPVLMSHAETLVAENEPGSELHNLGLAIIEREEQLDQLYSTSGLLDRDMDSLNNAVQSLSSSWDNSFVPGLQALQTLESFMESNNVDLIKEISALSDRLAGYGDYLEDMDRLVLEVEEMLQNMADLPGAVNELAYGQERLSKGLKELRESGVLALERGLIEGINESRYAGAKIELMQDLADDYLSFADNEQNRYSEVQFILQTVDIKADLHDHGSEEKEEEQEILHWSQELWARLINLF